MQHLAPCRAACVSGHCRRFEKKKITLFYTDSFICIFPELCSSKPRPSKAWYKRVPQE